VVTARACRVLHLAAYLRGVGGVASVVQTYEAASDPTSLAFTGRSTVDGSLGAPFDAATLRAVVTILTDRRRYDVVHVHVTQRGSLLREGMMVRVGRLRGLPVVVTVHGSSFNGFAAAHPTIATWALRPAAEVLCLTAETAAVVSSLHGAPRVSVVDNPVESVTPPGQNINPLPTALFLGEVGLRKGIDRLAGAWDDVRKDNPDVRLEIAGPLVADGREGLTRLLAIPGVTYHGAVAPPLVRNLIREAWLLVLPSRAEALPRAILETMAGGRAVVATDVGEIRSLVDGSTGAVVTDPRELAPTLISLLSDADGTRRLGAAARRRVLESHSLGDHLRRLAEVYDRAMAIDPQGDDR
jgi:glycosyltransferase involved in cell wall biosynthesis